MPPDPEHRSTPSELPAKPPTSPRTPSPGRIPGKLLVLGAAAVVTVYSVGFERTRLAAQQFADESSAGRRPLPQTVASAAEPAPDTLLIASQTVSAPIATSEAVTEQSGAGNSVVETIVSTKPTVAAKEPAAPADEVAMASKSAAEVVPKTESKPVAAVAAKSEPKAKKATDTAAATTAPSTTAVATATAIDSAAADTTPPAPVWKDGKYSGWGTSRHGNVEVTLVIAGGRIESAEISRCQTRYSCSWIEHLPQQAVKRQSADVDHVSGATQSADAFYYGVMAALEKAK